jgi:uncharacterized membrane protein
MRDHSGPARSFPSPLHAILLAFPVALYPSALLSDITYCNTAEIQWSNFSSWLIAGADLFAGLLLLWALVNFFFGRIGARRGRGALYLVLVAVMFLLGMINAFQHAKDGWHSVGTLGLILSVLCTLLALAIAFLAHSNFFVRERAA